MSPDCRTFSFTAPKITPIIFLFKNNRRHRGGTFVRAPLNSQTREAECVGSQLSPELVCTQLPNSRSRQTVLAVILAFQKRFEEEKPVLRRTLRGPSQLITRLHTRERFSTIRLPFGE